MRKKARPKMGSENDDQKKALQTPFERDFARAKERFTVISQGGNTDSIYVEAEAGTGSRYSVVISKLPFAGASREGGQHLISLLQPWQANMVFTVDGFPIHGDYLFEKLIMPARQHKVNGGDVAGICLAVNTAVGSYNTVTGYALGQQDAKNDRERLAGRG